MRKNKMQKIPQLQLSRETLRELTKRDTRKVGGAGQASAERISCPSADRCCPETSGTW